MSYKQFQLQGVKKILIITQKCYNYQASLSFGGSFFVDNHLGTNLAKNIEKEYTIDY